MTEQTVTTETVEKQAEQAQAPTPDVPLYDGQPFDPDRAKALIEKLKGEKKDLLAKAKRADELEILEKQRKDAELSEADKLKKQLDEANAKLTTLETQALKRQAAEETGLPAGFVDRLQGSTLDEYKADAKALLEAIQKSTKQTGANLSATNPGANSKPGGETDAERRKRLIG